jgi:peptidoglycan/LPS O-acetylase OafA/YrhL
MGPTWSLAVEEQFYLVLPLLIRLTPAKRVPWLFAALVAAAPLCRVAAVSLYGQPYAAYLLMPCRMDALFGGALLAWATAQPRCVAWLAVSRGLLYALIAMLAAGLLLMLARGLDTSSPLMWGPGYSWIAAFYASLLLAVVTRSNRATPPPWIAPLGWLGVHAYALYLFHRPIEILAHGLLPKGPAVPIAATLGALALAAVCWGVVEQPAIALGRRALRYDRDTAAPARRRERHPAVKIQ